MKYIIDFINTATEESIASYFTLSECNIIKVYNNFSKVYLVECTGEPTKTEIIESINSDDGIILTPLGEMIPVNRYIYTVDPSLPSISISTQTKSDWWKLYTLKNPDFDTDPNEISRRGNNIDVYIMDSGIDNSHPEFVNSNVELLFSVNETFTDVSGHGTAIASLISGNTCGLSSANLKIVKIFDPAYSTKQSDMLNALDSILDRYKERKIGAAVLNCSWHIARNEYIEQKMRELIRQGFFIVAAAGNSGQPITNVTPAAMEDVLTIGSYSVDLRPSDFSNYSNPSVTSNTSNAVNSGQLDGWAPGEEIWVATPGGGYGYSAGTSMAAAIQSCALAYNLEEKLLSTGVLPIFMQAFEQSILIKTSLGRVDILDLNDPKYANSANHIATIFTNFSDENIIVVPYFEAAIRVGENKSLGSVFNPRTTLNFELLSPLPDNFYITPDGTVAGAPISVDGNYEIYQSEARLTSTDNSIVDVPITIAVLNKDFDAASVPADDPILTIKLSGVACSGDPYGTNQVCDDDCANYGGSGCAQYGVKAPNYKACYCVY